jgi:hypothetical protein
MRYTKAHPHQRKATLKRYYNSHREQIKRSAKQHKAKYPERVAASRRRYEATHREQKKAYYKDHCEDIKAKVSQRQARCVRQAGDPYVKARIREKYGLATRDITLEMIELEREYLVVMRLVRQQLKETG